MEIIGKIVVKSLVVIGICAIAEKALECKRCKEKLDAIHNPKEKETND